MAKQLSWKQQMYQQIANSQVQQVLNQQHEQDLKMAQDILAQYQPNDDDMALANSLLQQYPQPTQQPVQQATVNQVKTESKPKQEKKIPTLADFNKEDYQKQQQLEQIQASRKAEKGGAEWNRSINNTLKALNSNAFKDEAKKGKAASVVKELEKQQKEKDKGNVGDIVNQLDLSKYNLPKENGFTEQEQKDFDDYSKAVQWADPGYKMTKEEQKEAKRIASEGMDALSAKYPVENKADFGKLYERMTPEDQEKYRTFEDLDYKSNFVAPFSIGAADKGVDMLGGALNTYAFFHPEAFKIAKDYRKVKKAWDEASDSTVDLVKSATPIAENVPLIGEVTPYGLGQTATQIGAYALTNDIFDELGTAVGGKLGGFLANQVGQNLQDIPLDTVPLIEELLKDGELSAEDWKAIGANIRNNAIGNLTLGAVQKIPALNKWLRGKSAAKKAANEATQASILEGAEKLAKLAAETDNAKKLPVMGDVDNIVSNATRQAETAAQNIEDIAKQMPEVPTENVKLTKPRPGGDMPIDPAVKAEANRLIQEEAIENAAKAQQPEIPEAPKIFDDDVKAQLDYDFDNLNDSYYGNREAIREALENKDFSMPDLAINEVPGKGGKTEYQLVDAATQRPIKSFKSLKAAEKAQAEYAAGEALKSKAIKAFEDLDGAIYNYEKAAYNAADVEEVNTAKKAVEAARKRYERAMKELDPDYYDAVSSKDFANRITKPYYTRNPAAENPVDNELMDELVNDWAKQDAENPNRFLRGTDQTEAPKRDLEIREIADKKGRPRYFVSEKISDTHSRPVEPGKTYKTIDEANEAVYRIKNAGNNGADLWDELKAAESNSMPKEDRPLVQMNLQQHGEEATSRAGKILQEITQDEAISNAPEAKVSEFYNNSMQRNNYAWDSEDLSDLYTADQFEYLPTSEKTSVKNAYDNIKANRDNLIDRYTKQADSVTKPKDIQKFYNSQDIDQMHLLIRDLRRKESMAKDPVQKALFSQQRFEITKHLYDATHSSAAVMQAGQKWLNDVDGIMDTAEAYRIKKANEVFEDNPKLKQSVNKLAEDIYNRFKELEQTNVLKDLSEDERKAKLRELIDDALSSSEVKRRLGQEDIEKLTDSLMKSPSADRILQGIEDALTNIGWIKEETDEAVREIWSQIEGLDPGSKDFQKGVTKIYTLLANDIGGSGTFMDKVDSWRYFAMLANPTTHIRNLLGNVTMNWMTGIKNNIAAGIEAVADKASKNGIQGGRTKAILTLKDGDLLDASGKYFDNHAYGEYVQGGNRYMSASSGIDDAMPVFKTKALDKAVGGHSNLLTNEDVFAGKAKYKTSLAGFLKANGADASIFNATDAASKDLLERANKYALEAANEATFHTNSAAANALSQFTKSLKASDSVALKALGTMIDTVIPFKKTPINILKNCFEYSPVEFAKVIMDIGNWKKGKIATSTMIDNLSKAITGTGGMALGALLAHEGVIKVTNGTNKEQSYDRLMGEQSLALNILGHDIDISFLPPSVMPLIMGATLLNDYQEKYGDKYTALDVLTGTLTDPELMLNTSLESLDTIVDTTMLSGINDTINTIRYADKPQDVVKSLAAKTATNYAGQMIPTLAKKTANVIDGQKYSSYSDKSGAAKTLDSSLKYLKTTIPGLQQAGKAMEGSSNKTIAKLGDAITAEPKINGWGEVEKKENYGLGIGGRAIDQYLNPATTTKNTEDKTTKAIRELSQRLNDENVLDIGTISTAESKFSLNKQQYKLNEKQWTTYSRLEGHTAKDLADTYVKSKQWGTDSDQDRAETLSKMKSFSKAYAQSKVVGAEMSSTNKELANIYKEKGAEGLIEEFHRQEVFSKYEVSKSDGANAVYQDLGEAGVEQYAKLKKKLGDSSKNEDVEKVLNSSGMSKKEKGKYYSYLKPSSNPGNNPYGYIPGINYDPEEDEAYQKAKQQLPTLKPEKYYETKDKIDTNDKGGVSQTELLDYINSQPNLSNSEAQKIWAAYGSDWKNNKDQIKKLVGNPGHYTSTY